MAETVQELIVKYSADITDLQVKINEIEKKLREAGQAGDESGKKIAEGLNRQAAVIDSLTRKLELLRQARDKSQDPARTQRINAIIAEQSKRVDELRAKHNSASLSFSKLFASLNVKSVGDQFKELGRNIVGAFAVQQVIAFGVASVKAFQEAELNAIKLKNAVGVNGGLQEDYERLLDQSNELQRVTIFSDDQIQVAQTAALQFGLTADEVEKLIPIIADFASATGQDLQSALNSVIQGVNGSERALKKYGVVLSEGGDSAERLSEITEQLNTKFIGQAEIVGETSAGAFKRFGNQIDDAKEGIGEFISELGDSAVTILSFIANGFEPLNDAVDETGISFKATAEEIRKFNSAIDDFQIGQLQQQIAQLQAADVDVTHLVTQLNLLTQKKFSLQVTGLSDDQLKARREELGKIPVLLAAQATELRLIDAEIQKRNLDFIVGQKELTKISDEELKKREAKLIEENKKTNNKKLQDSLAAIQEEIKRREEARKDAAGKAADAERREREKNLETLNQLEQKASDDLIKAEEAELDKVLQLENQKVREIQKIKDAFVNAGSPAEEFNEVEKAVGNVSRAFDILIGKEKELQAIQRKRREDVFAAANENEGQEAIDRELENIERATQERINNKTREFIEIGNFSKAAQSQLESDLLEIERDAARDSLEVLKQKGQDTLQAETDLLNAEKAILDRRLANEEEFAQKVGELQKELRDAAIDAVATLIERGTDSQADASLESIQEIKDAELESIDARLEANEEAREKGIIGERAANELEKQLLNDKKKAEEDAEKKIRSVKKRQFQADQTAAASKVIIATQIAVAEAGFNPVLTALYEGLMAIQLGLIATQVNPYKKGSKKTKSGLSLVGEEGPELMLMREGNKVLPANKTKRHADVIDAMFDNNLDSYIQRIYVKPALKEKEVYFDNELQNLLSQSNISPALKDAGEKAEVKKQESFAMNIANSFVMNKEFIGMTGKEFSRRQDEIRRKGIRVKNIDEFTQPIIQAIKSSDKPSFQR